MKRLFYIEKHLFSTKSFWIQLDLYHLEILKNRDYKIEPFKLKFILFSYDYFFNFNLSLFSNLVNFELSLSRNRDHAGFTLDYTLFGLDLNIHLYDERHWDEENENWQKY